MPTFTEILKEYALASVSYLWTLLPGVLMTLPDIINWFRVREITVPRWLKVAMFVVGLFAAQFLAYRDVRLRLQTEINEKSSIAAQNEILMKSVQSRRHGLDTTEPVFANTIYLLQAFRMYRVALGHDAKCTIYVTAPPDSLPTASMVAQFSIATSNCATAGPHGGDLTPTLEKEVLEGSVPGMVIVHAAEGDKTAHVLVNQLTHVFRVKRGYKSIPKGRISETYPPNRIWLQFGVNTRFASELRENKASVKQQ